MGPTTRRRQLATMLARLREQSGLSLEEAGNSVGVSRATVNRYEQRNGGSVRWLVVQGLCHAYGASEEETASAVELAKNAKVLGWWKSVTDDEAVPDYFAPLLALEDEAKEEWHWAPTYVPGLLQVRAYAEAVHRAFEPRASQESISRLVDVRMRRQEVLKREVPPHLWVIMDEALLRRSVGGPAAMAKQLAHLRECSREGLATLQVLPFEAGAHAADPTPFMILRGSDPSLDVVHIGYMTGGLYLEQPTDLNRHLTAFEYLRSQALSVAASDEMIRVAGETYASAAIS
jgi:transcriptional regulator with XRE-family HTH domain